MTLLRRIHFNFWYFRRPPWDSGISPPELFDFISKHPAGRAIDLGCGTGTNVITLVQNGWQAVGIDFAPRAIQIAKRKIKNANIQADLRVSDATQLNGIDGPFDLALDMGCFHGIKKRKGYLTQLHRVLAVNGYWLMYGILKSPQLGHGLVAADIELIQAQRFRLIWRKDGADKRERPSAWFLFQKF
ncbi:MAG: class I SAM-dependent methyltransferase [Anaerolineales bacterium]